MAVNRWSRSERCRMRCFTHPLVGEHGFTLTELIVAIVVVGLIGSAGITVYLGTQRSWAGSAALADVQRDAAFAMDIMVRGIRSASSVDIAAGADSMDVIFRTGTSDSVGATYYVDDQDRLIDMSGRVLVANVDSIRFWSSDGKTVNMDITLRHDLATPDRATDDQAILVSTSVVCRN